MLFGDALNNRVGRGLGPAVVGEHHNVSVYHSVSSLIVSETIAYNSEAAFAIAVILRADQSVLLKKLYHNRMVFSIAIRYFAVQIKIGPP